MLWLWQKDNLTTTAGMQVLAITWFSHHALEAYLSSMLYFILLISIKKKIYGAMFEGERYKSRSNSGR